MNFISLNLLQQVHDFQSKLKKDVSETKDSTSNGSTENSSMLPTLDCFISNVTKDSDTSNDAGNDFLTNTLKEDSVSEENYSDTEAEDDSFDTFSSFLSGIRRNATDMFEDLFNSIKSAVNSSVTAESNAATEEDGACMVAAGSGVCGDAAPTENTDAESDVSFLAATSESNAATEEDGACVVSNAAPTESTDAEDATTYTPVSSMVSTGAEDDANGYMDAIVEDSDAQNTASNSYSSGSKIDKAKANLEKAEAQLEAIKSEYEYCHTARCIYSGTLIQKIEAEYQVAQAAYQNALETYNEALRGSLYS